MIASNDSKYLSKIRMENALLFTTKQGLDKNRVNLDYGCLIWGRCSASKTLRLLKLQNEAARIILNADILMPSKWLFQELNWLTFPKRVQYGIQG